MVKHHGSEVDDAVHIVGIGGSKTPKDSPWSQLSIDVGVRGSTSTWSRDFLSPVAGLWSSNAPGPGKGKKFQFQFLRTLSHVVSCEDFESGLGI